ncbi:Electron transfer flavoprotein subunit alpha [invertebrate metagenome]|uniref:Electron transfer flavoprotein subunit alpha n=1 Tax=invertebrate metagenome TaxID=1711999 RepID=A0A2H9T6H5_9ZZZZ
MAVLIIADHNNTQLDNATLSTVSAAVQLNAPSIDLLILGENCGKVAEAASTISHIRKVLMADTPMYGHQLAENTSLLITDLAKRYDYVLFSATTTGKNTMPRVAALLDVEPLSDVMAVETDDTFKRPIYAGNAIATVQSHASIKVMTVRSTGFDPVPASGNSAPIETINAGHDAHLSAFISHELAESDRPELTAADIIVSGGRGMGNGDNFNMLYQLADTLGAAVGASRAAVDAGFVPNDMQVGQTGKIVAPRLYIAVGISGAIQHLAGMKDSKVIVAINKDEEAPIFQVADYGLVADLFEVLPELQTLL